MPKFIVIESQMVARRVEFKYNVEAESEAEAIAKVRDGALVGPDRFPERNDVGDEEYGVAGFAACDFDKGDEDATSRAAWQRMERAEELWIDALVSDDEEAAVDEHDPNEFRR